MNKWNRIRYMPNLPLEPGRHVTACGEHRALSLEAAKEGMVLLKNQENLLPLPRGTRLALFGKGTFDYVKGGGGSGDVTTAYTVNLYEGLQKLKNHVSVEENLANYYRNYVVERYAQGDLPGMIAEPELPCELIRQARAFADTAVISISRFSGEGWDRGGRGQALFERGDFYLSNAEAAMVEAVTAAFPRVIAVLNVGGMVDSQWFFTNDRVQSVLMAWQGGMEGGSAAAELLCGIGTPCGKLPDTLAKGLEDYPSTENFHESVYYVDYTEDIYVGYRYFETVPGAAQRVNYPFGYGLSYTNFDWDIRSAREAGDEIVLCVRVRNTGNYSGKEVLQTYVSAPQGKLGKPAMVLTAFRKTELLAPGGEQEVELRFPVYAMASYDDLGKVAKSAYVLEKGEYRLYVGTSVRNTKEAAFVYMQREDRVIRQLSEKLKPNSLKKRMLPDGSFEELPQFPVTDPNATGLPAQPEREKLGVTPEYRYVPSIPRSKYSDRSDRMFDEVAQGTMSLDEFMEQLTLEQLTSIVGGQPCLGVANTCGFGNLPEFRVPNCMTADGPAGVRIDPQVGVKTTAFPCMTLMASTWNPELTYAVGQAGAREIRENNLACWLTPAVNIHRSPLCGRNFEYYSEDPLLAGKMAAGMVRGIQSQGVAPSVKHFALNNKETNRKNSDSRVSERAAREIYLKVFEILVREADPWYIMSSYNLINGCRASENRELLEDILRGEWGFSGMVSTDWWTCGEQYKEVKAGNDLKMPGGFPARLQEAVAAGLLTREELTRSAKRILGVILRLA